MGCADILGIQDRFYDGGAISEAGADAVLDAPSNDAPSDGPGPDGASSCGTCTANGANCDVLACHQDTPSAITVASSHLFWANSEPAGGNNAVISSNLDGSNATIAYAGGGNELSALVTLGNDVYVSTFFGGSVVWIPGGGGSALPIATVSYAFAIGVDPLDKLIAISSFTSAGGVYTCAPNPPNACPSYEPVTNQMNTQGAAIDANDVYWSVTNGTTGIYQCAWAASCSNPQLLVASPAPVFVTVDGTYVYWVDGGFGGSTIWRADKGTGLNKIGLGSAPGFVSNLVVDGGYMYYASYGTASNGSVVRVKTDGSGSTNLATGLETASAVAVDATYAYFTEWGPFLEGGAGTDGRVMRVPR